MDQIPPHVFKSGVDAAANVPSASPMSRIHCAFHMTHRHLVNFVSQFLFLNCHLPYPLVSIHTPPVSENRH